MDTVFQILAGVLVAVVISGVLSRQNKELSTLLSVGVSCMVLLAACAYLKPVVEWIETLKSVANSDGAQFAIVLKAVGIGLIAQQASMICADSGNGAMGKAVEWFASVVILWLSIPLMRALLELVQQMTGAI